MRRFYIARTAESGLVLFGTSKAEWKAKEWFSNSFLTQCPYKPLAALSNLDLKRGEIRRIESVKIELYDEGKEDSKGGRKVFVCKSAHGTRFRFGRSGMLIAAFCSGMLKAKTGFSMPKGVHRRVKSITFKLHEVK